MIILQSKWEGDTKWTFRAEGHQNSKTYFRFYQITKEDRKLKAKNTYRIIEKKN